MKSPLFIWAHSIRKHMQENQENVTPESLAAHMIVEDRQEVIDFFFGQVPPSDPNKLADVINRIDTIHYVAKMALMH